MNSVRRVDADDPDVDIDMGHRLLYQEEPFTGEVAEYQDEQIVCLDVYLEGVRNGLSERWYPDGTLKLRGTVVNGAASGEFLEWHPNGVLKSRKFFDDDIYSLREESVWDEQGDLVRVWHREDGAGLTIRAGRPAVLRSHASAAADMADAVGELYSSDAEDAVLVWSGVPVRLSYAHDLAALLDDLVPLLEEVRRPEFSETEVFWGSDTFSAEWRIVREGESLRIRARWHSTLGNCESLLAERGDPVVPAQVFVSEWAKPLRRIVTDIEAEAVELQDDDIFLRAKALLAA
ncbi:toxin-antitoxin system YwqK family antitoxin [Streptomyces sp. NPDC096033]|uniref:toxin-antitoxin system YwqK family antitoxin n=1 Tax=Streptomyces sp. NPDC096033 TaxID=3366071 RepID=UPI0037F8B077